MTNTESFDPLTFLKITGRPINSVSQFVILIFDREFLCDQNSIFEQFKSAR